MLTKPTTSLLLTLLLVWASAASAEGYRLVRWGEPGSERPGVLDPAGRIRDLSAHFTDFTPATLRSTGWMASR